VKAPDPARVPQWDFVDDKFQFVAPDVAQISVKAGARQISVKRIGFKRRPIYIGFKKRDLRVGNHLYLELEQPIAENEAVEVMNPDGKLWRSDQRFAAKADPMRVSPVIHVNEEGYCPAWPKQAMVGYFLGNLGEMDVPTEKGFSLADAAGKNVFTGKLMVRSDAGYDYSPKPYQEVYEADFSGFKTPGEYRLQVPTLGVSFPFRIDDGIAADFARTYALGLYHQRCGTSNELPFTRFTHAACHTRPAEVPGMTFAAVNEELANMTGDAHENKRHTAPALKNVAASLYPFVRTNKIDVSGGHHDAGDYSKYTINVAHLIHVLTFAADTFPGVGALDNLGIPESGDGKSDVLQEAKWEADFLAKLQDDDGGFYFLVYPRDREYEDNVSLMGSDTGDTQVVFPKTTAATAASVAALAQISSSPLFKKQFPEASARYLTAAKKGWGFLERAFAKYGRDGSYQKITHYGDEFMHDDEIAWAACELFLATGDHKFEKELIDHFNPHDPNTKRWTWWRLFECYGNVIRSYAFAARTKRIDAKQLDPKFLADCEDELIGAANDTLKWALENAYGTSFPSEYKRFRNAGWYFSLDRAFDLAVACQLDFPELNDPRPSFIEAIISNMNYEGGCNPLNICFVTGIGWKRQHQMVNHYANNQRRHLPPTGLAIANVQDGFMYLDAYKKEPTTLTCPTDWDEKNPYPFYDRWSDAFNTSTEFVTVNLARSLAATAFLMARSSIAKQTWRSADGTIQTDKNGVSQLVVDGMDLKQARCVWEDDLDDEAIQPAAEPFHSSGSTKWMEAEAWWPDGRRAVAIKSR
ncbi:MAG: glycoside hydrolase family 9 protein, partial [Limisphaerales bacterium]